MAKGSRSDAQLFISKSYGRAFGVNGAFDGTNPPIPDWAIYWSVSFSLLSLIVGLTVSRRQNQRW